MGRTQRLHEIPRARFDVKRIVADMTLKGWMNTDLARAAGLSDMTISRFLSGQRQTARTAAAIAKALGYLPRRYFIDVAMVKEMRVAS